MCSLPQCVCSRQAQSANFELNGSLLTFFQQTIFQNIPFFGKLNKNLYVHSQYLIFFINLSTFIACLETFLSDNRKLYQKPLPSDNFNINNKNGIPSKYILIFDIQIKTRCVKRLKWTHISKCLKLQRRSINWNLQHFSIKAKKWTKPTKQ